MFNAGHERDAAVIATRPLPKGRDAIRLLLTGLIRVPQEPSARLPLTRVSHWLVLSLVIERASHAYGIGARYAQRFGSFAPTATNAVYQTLNRLSEHNFVASSPETHVRRRPVRVIYKATQAGVEARRRWHLSSIYSRDWRTDLLARIATGTTLSRDELLTLIRLYEQMTLEHIQQIYKPPIATDEDADSPAVLIGQLLAEEQAAIASAQLAWAENAKGQAQHFHA